ncbi:nuclear transport factor 2 family protein [Antrihabitans sp. YC3-6]|uniref:Nuclear transport factor 2 family protein n=1 Tax=Antrihabitans stalagmiti TaxID=2799499 RepID=A0A934NPQ6_9NOCA|nr:nuclear transport factor 2 family protein [Antrihabitans stalagmiti]MBJ8339141.1 nuclear transport factor 2 family protein [Antrihabitans stalagmiti]
MSSIVAEREADLERSSLEYVFNRYHDAWEAKDPDAIAALHSEDSSYALRAGEDRVHGRTALREHFRKVFEQYPNFRADVARLILGAGHWVLEWTMVIDLFDTDGKPFTARIDLVDVVDVDQDGLVSRKDVYVDGPQRAAAFGRAGAI